jgi:hypothetical protein
MILVVHPGSRIRILTYPSRIPDPGVKKAPDPGFGSATLVGLVMGSENLHSVSGASVDHSE